jgi:hypothetical protein
MIHMRFSIFLCLLTLTSFLYAEEKRTLILPPELQQKLACNSDSLDELQEKISKMPHDEISAATKIAPSNNRCVDAAPVGFGTIVSETCGASRDGSSSCQQISNAPDIWYLFEPDEDTAIAINTFGSNYDTLLSVHTGCPGTSANEIVCSDDCGSPDSCLSFNAIAGTPYWIRVGGFQRDAGRTSLTISKQGSFGGRITDAVTNQGIPDAIVLVYTKDAEFVKTVTADSSGRYVADGLGEGKYIARSFNSAGYIDEVYENVVCEGLNCTPDGATLITVAGGGFTQVPFALDPGGDVRGLVTDSKTGSPIEGIEVHVHDLSNVHISVGFTDSTGRYDIFDGLPAGLYIVFAFNNDGFVDELYDNVPCVRGTCSTSLATILRVDQGSVVNDINISLDVGGRIVGAVLDETTDLPISGVQIQIFNSGGIRISSASSNAAGEYTSFDGLPSGDYFVRTNNFKHYIDELHDAINCPAGNCAPTSGTPVRLIVGSESNIDFTLNPGAIISGNIKDTATNNALTGILIDIYDANGNRIALEPADISGNYSSLSGLPEGNYFLKTLNQNTYLDELYDGLPCPGSSCNPLSGTPVFVGPGNNANNINFALTRGGALSGRISESANGLPISDIFVLMLDSNNSLSSFGLTDGCGEYSSIVGMLPGEYKAVTSNLSGFIDEVYDDLLCLNGCDISKATPIPLSFGELASNIDFDLSLIILRDEFQDDQMDWNVKSGDWTEQDDFLKAAINASSNRASAVAPVPWTPSGATSCSRCTLETAIKMEGGAGGKVMIRAWKQNSSNYVELSIREDKDKFKFKQLVDGKIVASKTKTSVVNPDALYRIKLRYDGVRFQLWVDDNLLMSVDSAFVPTGSMGFEVVKTTALFDYILIY